LKGLTVQKIIPGRTSFKVETHKGILDSFSGKIVIYFDFLLFTYF